MSPAFNLSQEQTLQFNACYCFLFLRIGRSLNVLTSSSHLPVAQKTLKSYLNTSVRLDTFASRQRSEEPHHTPKQNTKRPHLSAVSFKRTFAKPAASTPSGPRRFRVAASAA